MAIDLERIDRFMIDRPLRERLREVLRQAGLEISWVEEVAKQRFSDPYRWWVAIKPTRDQQLQLSIGREFIIYVCETDDCQARTVSQAREIIHGFPERFSSDLAIVITNDPNTRDRVAEASALLPTPFIGLSDSELEQLRLDKKSLVLFMRQQLFSRDLYAATTAILDSGNFFGRKALLNDLHAALRSSSQHVGLFGLRKMGKTSVLLQLCKRIRSSANSLLAYVDLQKIDAVDPSAEYLLWSIADSAALTRPSLRSNTRLRLFGKYRLFGEMSKSQVFEYFDHDIKVLINEDSERLFIILDEVELMDPDRTGSRWGEGFVRAWRFLRGIAQEMKGGIGFCVAGTNPSVFEKNAVAGIENPVYNYFTIRYLDRLSQAEVLELLCKIGQRVGLNWTEPAASIVYEQTGGHPYLARSFASRVSRAVPRLDKAVSVEARDVSERVDDVISDVSAFLGQMLAVMKAQYPNDYTLCELLARGQILEFRQMAAEFAEDAAHLRGYGLVDDPEKATSLSIALLQTWFQRRPRARPLPPSAEVPQAAITALLSPGSSVDGFSVHERVCASSGFGQVFRATDRLGRNVALKVLYSGKIANLDREVTAMQDVSHPSIVKIYDYGVFYEKFAYISMEFLDGRTLRQFCDKSSRLDPDEVCVVGSSLLDALSHLHPDLVLLDQARRRGSRDISEDEWAAIQQAREGIIHRDIKPENIIFVKGRGPVLIDFGISSKADDDARTLSCTPGYLPPDFAGRWDADVDLYALGMTLLQVATGASLETASPDDLREAASGIANQRLRRYLMRATAPSRSDRYMHASSALRDIAAVD